MKIKLGLTPVLAGCAFVSTVHAISTNDIQIWTGSGTNRAALVIEWSAPEVINNSTVPAPVTDKTMVWGYRFNGTATATEMFNAVVAADRRLYAVVEVDPTFGTYVEGIGYNLSGNGMYGVSDGTNAFPASGFASGILNITAQPHSYADAAYPLDAGDLYWGGYNGPNWTVWNELNDAGGFAASPNRGSSPFWDPNAYSHGQWSLAFDGLDFLPLVDGSWIGFTVAAAGYATTGAAADAYNSDEHAPPSPEGNYTAYVNNTNDFATQVVSTNGVYTASPYNDPTAMLGRPVLKFLDGFGDGAEHRAKIIEAPYNVATDGSDVITEISANGQVTLKMGRKVYDDPRNPYGIDLIVYGNSFFSATGLSGFIDDATDLDTAILSAGYSGHGIILSVSQDGTNWFAYPNSATIFPDNAYRWDETNASWTDELMNPTKPINPVLYGGSFGGKTVAAELDRFVGASGGTGYDLKGSGFPWIQYVRIAPLSGTYAVIDAIAAVNPMVVGDDLSIIPAFVTAGTTNFIFQAPYDASQTLISINFDSISETAKVSTTGLSEFSAFAPVPGNVLSGYQITVAALPETNQVTYRADVGLSAGTNYRGNGADLCVLQWTGTNWSAPTFAFDAGSESVSVAGVTNLSAFVVTQLARPELSVQTGGAGRTFVFTPGLYLTYVLERSTDLKTWAAVGTNVPVTVQPVTLQDAAPPAQQAFYRLRVHP